MLTEEQASQLKQHLLAQLSKLPKEQVATLEEKIKEMSPSELETFMQQQAASEKQACLFCQIIQGKIETTKVFEDDNLLVILDINPASLAHAIIMPKKHFQFLNEIPDEIVFSIFKKTKELMPIIAKLAGAKGFSIFIDQAEQRVPHFAINLIPRYEKDGIVFEWQRNPTEKKQLQDIAKKISSELEKEKQEKTKEKAEKEKISEEEKKREESDIEKMMKHGGRRLPH